MITFIIFFIDLIVGDTSLQLFAGNGLKTSAHTILHNRIIYMNCTTYDDCYYLLCGYLLDDVYDIVIEPNQWAGNCDQLNSTDKRLLLADFFTETHDFETRTVSDASFILCVLKKINNTERIGYFGLKCDLSIKISTLLS
jgi:hypothetical protein